MKDKKRQGPGLFTWETGEYAGTFYKGEFKEDKFEGKGVIYHNDGESYSGDWKDDLADGYGTYTYLDGTVYEGMF